MKKVSIIVPIYNKENSIKRCVDSILTQEYKNIELILIDDGSTDKSPKICDNYKKKDNRVVVIHKKNAGVSSARNDGIKIATGNYIQFVDADDYITKDSTKILMRSISEKNCGLAITHFYRVVGKNVAKKGAIDEKMILNKADFAEFMIENPADYYYGVLWNKIFKKEIIDKYDVKMDETLSFCEDFIFNLEYMLHIDKISVNPVPTYYYVKTEGSLIAQGFNISDIVRMKLNVIEYYDNFYKSIYDLKDYKKKKIEIYKFLFSYARDEFTVPLFPGTKKVGLETVPIYANLYSGENIFLDVYFINKLLDRYLKTVALQHGLILVELKILIYIKYNKSLTYLIEVADFIGCTQFTVFSSLQKLLYKKLLKKQNINGTSTYTITNNAADIIKSVDIVVRDFYDLSSKGLKLNERKEYYKFYKNTLKNIKGLLDNTKIE